jgi:hypothetical protein
VVGYGTAIDPSSVEELATNNVSFPLADKLVLINKFSMEIKNI